MATDSLHERGKELEEAFFRQMNEKLTEKLKAEAQAKLDKEALSKLTGIKADRANPCGLWHRPPGRRCGLPRSSYSC